MDSQIHHEESASKPIAGIAGVEETSNGSEFEISIESDSFSMFFGYIVLVGAPLSLGIIGVEILRRLGYRLAVGEFPSHIYWYTVFWWLFVFSLIFAFVAAKVGVIARMHRVIITPEEIRSVWGRWVRTIKLTELKEIRVTKVGGEGGPYYEVHILGPSWRPIQLLSRGGEGSLAAAHAIRDRLQFVIAQFTVDAATTGPYRSRSD